MIIKCPECGHQVSDKAPVCPSCGVEIAGHIVRCSHCGELYLKEEPSCPNCHHTETENPSAGKKGGTDGTKKAGPIVVLPMEEHPADGKETVRTGAQKPAGERKEAARDAVRTPSADAEADEAAVDADFLMEDDADEDVIAAAEAVQEADEAGAEKPAQKHGHVSLAVSLLIAAITAAVLLFLYNQGAGVSRANGEQEAYALALSSDEPTVLQNYLSDHPAAPKTHRDSVSARLKRLVAADRRLQTADRELEAAMSGNSTEELKRFLAKYPASKHRKEVEARIDEMDWAQAAAKDDENAYLGYKAQHADGIHSREADEKLKQLLVHTVSDEEKSSALGAVRQLLQGMNSKSSDKIAGAVAPSLSFLGAGGATAKDIRRYMTDRLYQADVKTINWRLGSPAEITKDSNDEGAELRLKVPATLDIERKGGRSRRNYVISAVVKGGRITSVNWNQI